MRILIAYLSLVIVMGCHGGGESNVRVGDGTRYVNNTGDMQWVELPDGSHVKLSDGAVIGLGPKFAMGNRVVDLDGEGMFEVHGMNGRLFVVITKNLIIQGPGTKFRVDAVRKRPGEEVDLLEGKLTVRKSYHSDMDNEPEMLVSGDMVMINREIDLMEKEKMNAEDVKKAEGRF
jgi:transmembrane sensor